MTEMQYQHLVFEEFARTLVPSINLFVGDGINFQSDTNPAITAEFAHQVYRLGHSMLTETIERTFDDGTRSSITLFDGFLNPLEFNNKNGTTVGAAEAAGAIFQGGARQRGMEIDEFIVDVLRNQLLGLPLDLGVLNISRGRSEGVAPLNVVRQQLFDFSGSSELEPYANWVEFGFGLKHFESLPNFVAAYGTHPTVTAATTIVAKRSAAQALVDAAFTPGDSDGKDFMFGTGTWTNQQTGLNSVDLWVGGLAEKIAPFGGMLGSTFNFIFESQLENLQNADRFYYLERLDGLNFLSQLEGNSFAELIGRNSTADGLPAVAFFRPDCVFNMDFLHADATPGAPLFGFGEDDPSDDGCDEGKMAGPNFQAPERLVKLGDGTIRYLGGLHTIWNGSDIQDNPATEDIIECGPVDRVVSSEGDDTIHGNCGDDVIEAGSGNDNVIGGLGDDIITDLFGDDVLKGGPDDDVISGGSGLDLLQGNAGDDFIVAGNDESEIFGGSGDDVLFTGVGATESFGGAGDDWLEGGPQLNLLVGDENNQFQDDPSQGHDVIVSGKGDNDFDSEGGDDVMVSGVLGTMRLEGMLGFDWATYRGDPLPVDADMSIRVVLPPNLDELRDRFDLTESVSGFDKPDILRGTDNIDTDLQGGSGIDHVLTVAGVDRVFNLRQFLTAAGVTVPPTTGTNGLANVFDDGDIIFGGASGDILEGRGGNDIIDGDRWFNAQLCNGDPAVVANCKNGLQDYKAGALAGTVDPGDLEIRRSIEPGDATGTDEVRFTGARANYTVTAIAGGVRVTDTVGTDGTDTVLNSERLRFQNGTIGNLADDVVLNITDRLVVSSPTLNFGTRARGTAATSQTVTVSNQGIAPVAITGVTITPGVTTPPTAANTFTRPAAGGCIGVTLAPGASCQVVVTFNTTPGGAATNGPKLATLSISSNLLTSPTNVALTGAWSTDVNPTGEPTISDTTPIEGQTLTAAPGTIADANGLTTATFSYQWQAEATPEGAFANVGSPASTFVVPNTLAGRRIRVIATFTDDHGTTSSRRRRTPR